MTDRRTKTITTRAARCVYLAAILLIIPIGLFARSHRDGADASTLAGFVATYLGDVLWATMFFLVFALITPRRSTLVLSAITLVFTLGIEASQLYQGEPLKTLRAFKPTGFLLGKQFLWSDVACLVVGTALAAGLHRLFMPQTLKHDT
ncbi:MAG: DUF2809 domain-containing protein [Phycisphaeraceae bacterium]